MANTDVDTSSPVEVVAENLLKRVADNLSHATYVEFDGTGHGVSRTNACADQLVLSFVDQPSTPLDTSCVSTIGPPAFQLP